jgi:hypothetical protein
MHRNPIIALSLALCLAACSEATPRTSPDTLVSVLADPSPSDETRQQADARLVVQTSKTNPARLTILARIFYAPGHSDVMRMYAMDQLADADRGRCIDALAFALPRMESWPVLTHACELAVTLHDPKLLNALVCSLDRPATRYARRDRPEAKAIVKLSGHALDVTLLAALSGTHDRAVKIAALDVLREVEEPQTLRKSLQTIPPGDPFVDDLRWSIATFDYIPRGPNEVLWMHQLHQDRYAETIRHAAHAHQMLLSQANYVFAPRFVQLLASMDDQPATLTFPRDPLVADLQTRLAALKHVRRTPAYEHAADDVDESLTANLSKLSRCDLLAIHELLVFLPDATLRQTLYRAGLTDQADTSSEHGGLLFLRPADAGVVATVYPPLFSTSDFQYIPSSRLYADAAGALAMFHFHYQQSHNGEKAGPGEGDLQSAAKNLYTGVVITSIDERHFNVDYFNPNGAVVDLGVYSGQ